MWVSKKELENLQREIFECKKEIEKMRDEINQKLFDMAKKILRQPDELSKEIDTQESIERFVEHFIKS